MKYKTEYKTVTLPEVQYTINEYEAKGYIYSGSSRTEYTATLKFDKPIKDMDNVKLSDIILENIENIHIDAIGKFLGETENINIDIDFSNLKNPQIEIKSWEERNPITRNLETKRSVSITFNDYEMDFNIGDSKKKNILSCLWEASSKGDVKTNE